MRRKTLWSGVCLLAAGAVLVSFAFMRADESRSDPALERTRKQVRMLDDLYKTAVVLITDKFVHSKDDFPAGGAAVALFDVMKKKGWHDVRLVDATGRPRRRKNAPKDDFERQAVEALKAGKGYYETVADIDAFRLLRAATPIPVVSEKCIMCHAHYEDAKDGEPIGILSYSLVVE